MEKWVEVAAAAVPALLLTLISILIFLCYRRRRKPDPAGTGATLQEGIARLRNSYSPSCITPTLGFHSLERRLPGDAGRRLPHQEQPVFSWEDHPVLVAEAAVGGWSKFAFSSAPQPPAETEVGWEKPKGSSGFMQAVRLNAAHGARRKDQNPGSNPNPSPFCSVMMDLPLPGPPAEGTSFPKEAYFEVTVLYVEGRRRRTRSKARPIDRFRQMFPGSRGEGGFDLPAEPDRAEEAEGVVALGLSRGGCDEDTGAPGIHTGSIAFFSNGSIFLDGAKLVSETAKYQWAITNKVIGCGFNPRKKKAIYTLDSELIHAVHCSSAAFARPLFPIIAANIDVMVLVNLGQKPFAYKPANAWRSPDPCCVVDDGHSVGDKSIVSEMSQELFSIGRMDPWWREKGDGRKGKGNSVFSDNHSDVVSIEEGSIRGATKRGHLEPECTVVDIDAESDLFEIELRS